ncbi:hypothetical protein EHM69_10970 [candidate division KSB1 bacterium]|nr:MAG: hypothetical protein EHM69_10970 [candidate division KSB1 bacterium]
MAILRMPLRVGEILSATVRRKLSATRVLISLKGHTLVAEPEHDVSPGDEINVQVLTIFPRIRLRMLPTPLPHGFRRQSPPLDLHT